MLNPERQLLVQEDRIRDVLLNRSDLVIGEPSDDGSTVPYMYVHFSENDKLDAFYILEDVVAIFREFAHEDCDPECIDWDDEPHRCFKCAHDDINGWLLSHYPQGYYICVVYEDCDSEFSREDLMDFHATVIDESGYLTLQEKMRLAEPRFSEFAKESTKSAQKVNA